MERIFSFGLGGGEKAFLGGVTDRFLEEGGGLSSVRRSLRSIRLRSWEIDLLDLRPGLEPLRVLDLREWRLLTQSSRLRLRDLLRDDLRDLDLDRDFRLCFFFCFLGSLGPIFLSDFSAEESSSFS